jgi:hypothetical protein
MLLKVFVAAICCLTAVAAADAQTILSGRIVGVADGDTLTVLDAVKTQHKIRLDGIAAPEKGQPFGNRSKQSLSDPARGRYAAADCGYGSCQKPNASSFLRIDKLVGLARGRERSRRSIQGAPIDSQTAFSSL